MMKRKVVFLLGSNMGDRCSHLRFATMNLELYVGEILGCSAVYETDAWGNTEVSAYLNQAVVVSTGLTPSGVLHEILQIEKLAGRIRRKKWDSRVLDIDILFYEDWQVEEEDLKIPHPYVQDRMFALVPANEICADWMHPRLGRTLRELKNDCTDTLQVVLHNCPSEGNR